MSGRAAACVAPERAPQDVAAAVRNYRTDLYSKAEDKVAELRAKVTFLKSALKSKVVVAMLLVVGFSKKAPSQRCLGFFSIAVILRENMEACGQLREIAVNCAHIFEQSDP